MCGLKRGASGRKGEVEERIRERRDELRFHSLLNGEGDVRGGLLGGEVKIDSLIATR